MSGPHLAAWRAPHEAETVDALGAAYRYRAVGDDTSNAFSIFEVTAPEGFAAPMHLHDNEAEAFYILSGTVTLFLAGQEHTSGTGGFGLAPVGLSHSFRLDSADARLLLLITPGNSGHEALFRDLAAAVPNDSVPDFALIASIAGSHGTRVVGPPPGAAKRA